MPAEARTIPVYEALAHDLQAMGVDTVFGLMSDDTAHFGVTLDAIGIKFIGARHENIALVMADARSPAPASAAARRWQTACTVPPSPAAPAIPP